MLATIFTAVPEGAEAFLAEQLMFKEVVPFGILNITAQADHSS